MPGHSPQRECSIWRISVQFRERAEERLLFPDLILAPHVMGEKSVQRDCCGLFHVIILSENLTSPENHQKIERIPVAIATTTL